MTIGRDNGLVYVNSAQSLSRDQVVTIFPDEADDRGAIAWEVVARDLGADAVVGRVAIREEFSHAYARLTGHTITDERARQLLRGYPYARWRDAVECTTGDAIEQWARDQAAIRAQGIATRTGTTTP